MNKPLLRVGEAADVLAVSRWTIYRWVEEWPIGGHQDRAWKPQSVPCLVGSVGAAQ